MRKRSRNAAIGQTGARGLGDMPSSQLHPAIWWITLGSWAMTEIGGWGWQHGLSPSPHAPVWPMESFRDRFLTAFR